MDNLLKLLEPFRRIVAGRTGIIGLPSRLSIINCCLSEEGKLEALGRKEFWTSPLSALSEKDDYLSFPGQCCNLYKCMRLFVSHEKVLHGEALSSFFIMA